MGSFVTNVMNRHPAVLARMVATLAELSRRAGVELGIGVGGHPAEHEAYGIDFPPRPERAEHLVEAIEVLRRLFGGGPVDYEGRYYRLRGRPCLPGARPGAAHHPRAARRRPVPAWRRASATPGPVSADATTSCGRSSRPSSTAAGRRPR